jgi:multicomponent Na+:H+ antiporter subunit D
LLIAGIGFVVLLYAGPSLRSELPGDEPTFFAVASLLVASLQGMVITGDLFNLYVFLEISAITAYALIASGGGAASLASYRYLIIGTIGASFYLLGVGYLLSIAGTLNMADLAARLPQLADSPAASVALALMVSGLALKMAVVPMHGWLPDAYTYAPSAATALIAGLMTKVSAFALLRILYSIFAPAMPEVISVVSTLLGALACAGILFGSFMAVAQTDFKRMLAYSSITHLGFVAMGLALGNEAGLLGAMLHIVAHAITKACLFLIAGGVSFRHGSRSIDSFSGLHRNMPLTMAALVVAALSMIGIPPTVGFFSKWYLLVGALQANRPEYFVVLLVSTLLSAWYFLRIVEKVYFGADSVKRPRQELPGAMLAPIAATALAVILVGLATSSLIERLLRQPIHTIAVVQQAAESIPEVRHVRR